MKEKYVSISTDPVAKESEEKIVDYAKKVLSSGADFLHCDIMDGKFVERKTFDEKIVEKINKNCLIPLDVHLMVEKPEKQIERYKKAGANFLTVHFESFKNEKKLINCLKLIREKEMLSGVSFKPETSVLEIQKVLPFCDIVLVMSVEPGKSGQEFLKETFQKIKELNSIKKQLKLNFKIEVDGGINPEISKKLFEKGADIIVSGNYFKKEKNKKNAIKLLKNN